jgi:hypothetical protein
VQGGTLREYWSPDSCVSTVGDTVVALWNGASTLEAHEALGEILRGAARDNPTGITYLNVVESRSTAPCRAGRQLMGRLIADLGPSVRAAAWAVANTTLLRVVVSVMNGSLSFGGVTLNRRFFLEVPTAAAWLAQHDARAGAGNIVRHVEQIRAELYDGARWHR